MGSNRGAELGSPDDAEKCIDDWDDDLRKLVVKALDKHFLQEEGFMAAVNFPSFLQCPGQVALPAVAVKESFSLYSTLASDSRCTCIPEARAQETTSISARFLILYPISKVTLAPALSLLED